MAQEPLAPRPVSPLEPVANVVVPMPVLRAHALAEEPSPLARPPMPESSNSEERWPWPELPEPQSPESPDGAVLLLYWERLNRLDREQRGE
jgi:hypothetical protein